MITDNLSREQKEERMKELENLQRESFNEYRQKNIQQLKEELQND